MPPMRHRRHYTLEEARERLPWVMDRLAALRSARERLTDEGARATLGESAPGNGGGRAGRDVGEGFLDLQAGVAAGSSTSRRCATATRSTCVGSTVSPTSSSGTSSTPASRAAGRCSARREPPARAARRRPPTL
jgi:hypothetical protein